MVSILTARNKDFFHHVKAVHKQNCIQCNLWGLNPLAVIHFNAGFLGVKPDFAENTFIWMEYVKG